MFAGDVKPIITGKDGDEFNQQFRRWYAMQAIGNIWDVGCLVGTVLTAAPTSNRPRGRRSTDRALDPHPQVPQYMG